MEEEVKEDGEEGRGIDEQQVSMTKKVGLCPGTELGKCKANAAALPPRPRPHSEGRANSRSQLQQKYNSNDKSEAKKLPTRERRGPKGKPGRKAENLE